MLMENCIDSFFRQQKTESYSNERTFDFLLFVNYVVEKLRWPITAALHTRF